VRKRPPLDISADNGDTTRLVLSGDLDLYTSQAFLDRITQALASAGDRRVAVDVAGVSFIDSSGIAALVKASRLLRDAGGDLRVERANARVFKLLDLTGVAKLLVGDGRASP
jgi:anti-sigma B factor antagonist